MEANLYVAAFNYLEIEHFVNVINSLPGKVDMYDWESFQLFIKREDDEIWTIYTMQTINELNEY